MEALAQSKGPIIYAQTLPTFPQQMQHKRDIRLPFHWPVLFSSPPKSGQDPYPSARLRMQPHTHEPATMRWHSHTKAAEETKRIARFKHFQIKLKTAPDPAGRRQETDGEVFSLSCLPTSGVAYLTLDLCAL